MQTKNAKTESNQIFLSYCKNTGYQRYISIFRLLTVSFLMAFLSGIINAQPLPTDAIFAPTSFWYTPIPTNVTLHSNSANFVAEIIRQKNLQAPNVNTNSYCSPVFIATATTPRVKVNVWDCTNKGYADASLTQQWASVPIPSGAAPAVGSDMEMTIYDPSTHAMWEFWRAQKNGAQWEACWGGGMQNTNTNQGIWPNPYGTTATGLPFLGGQITAEELKRGEIRHAIGIALIDLANWNVVSWPATRSDGYNPTNAPNRIAEGQRLRLDPTINVDLLNIHPVAKIIAKAAQKYGFVVWDHAGCISIRAQNPTSYTLLGQPNPYTALYNGTPEWALLNNFPWDKLQFLPMDYGKYPAPSCTFQPLPGLIQAENFCSMNGIQTEATTDVGGGFDVGYINQGDYMDYPVNIIASGSYTITYRVASMVSGAQFELRKGTTVLNAVTVPNTGGWQTWQTVNATVNLSAGQQTLRIYSTQTAGWNINWFEVRSNAAAASVSIALTAGSNGACAGSSLTFKATPTNGGATPAYQWKVSGVNVGTNSATYTTTTLTNGQNVTCVMTSNLAGVSGSPATSNAITISVAPSIVPAVSIARTAGNNPTCAGSALTFTATPTNGGTIPSYQWKVSGVNVGTNSATFTTSTITNGQVVTCVLTSNANCASPVTAISSGITIAVNPVPSLPGLLQAESYCSMFGVQTEATTDAGGGLDVGYIDQGDYLDYPVNVTSAGTYTISYRIASLMTGAQFELRKGTAVLNTVTVPNTGGWQNWQTVTATINLSAGQQTLRLFSTQIANWNINWFEVKSAIKAAVSIALTTGSNPACTGSSLTFKATPANGGTIPSYQWKVSGVNVGTNSATYTTITITNGQNVTCVMTSNLAGVVGNPATSNAITMGITPVVTPAVSIALITGSNPTCSGSALTFKATPTNGGTAPSYQWKVNGINAGTNSATFTTSALTNGQTVSCVLTSNASCASAVTATSAGIAVTVNPATTTSTLPGLVQAESFCSMFGVQTETTTDIGGGLNVGYIELGDYMDYPVNITTAGTYTITYRVASLETGGQFQLRNGTTLLNTITVANTGGWQNWQTVTASVTLRAGTQTLRVISTQAAHWNINWFEVKASGAAANPTAASSSNSGSSGISSDMGVTGIMQAENVSSFNIYPSPSDGNFTLSFTSADKSSYVIEAINELGQTIYREALTEFTGVYSKQLNIKEYGTGLYLISVTNDKQRIIKKVIVN